MEGSLTEHHARVIWEGTKQDLRSHRIELAGETVRGSAAAALGGDGERADPEEMFVGSLSACHMLWFLALARGRRPRITAYEDDAVGTMDATRITGVALRPRVEFEQDPGAELLAELHHEAHENCFLANSVNCPVEVVAAGAAGGADAAEGAS